METLAPSFSIGSFSFFQPCGHSSAPIFDRIFFILSGNEDNHKVWTEFNLGQIGPRAAELAALERIKTIPIDLLWEKCCGHSSEFIFNWVFFILAGNKHMHKNLNEFEYLPDLTTDFEVINP